jgi:hypothetical protein
MVVIVSSALPGKAVADDDFAVTVYGGRMTDDSYSETLSGQADFIDAYMLVAAFSWTFARYLDDALSLEVEAQVGKWWGDQDNMEFNLPVAMRWNRFPWNHIVSTSLAFGLGPSYATDEPEGEIERHDETQRFLIYWFGELALGPPASSWAWVVRLHHRSGAFGLVADQGDGGSNTLAAGLKYRF